MLFQANCCQLLGTKPEGPCLISSPSAQYSQMNGEPTVSQLASGAQAAAVAAAQQHRRPVLPDEQGGATPAQTPQQPSAMTSQAQPGLTMAPMMPQPTSLSQVPPQVASPVMAKQMQAAQVVSQQVSLQRTGQGMGKNVATTKPAQSALQPPNLDITVSMAQVQVKQEPLSTQSDPQGPIQVNLYSVSSAYIRLQLVDSQHRLSACMLTSHCLHTLALVLHQGQFIEHSQVSLTQY